MGWLALAVPESAGGLSGSIEDVALLNVAFGKSLAAEPYVSTAVLANHVIQQSAGDERAAGLLGEIAAGTLRVALAHLENGADPLLPTAAQATARRSGDDFVLDGRKLMVLDAPSAGALIVSARIDGEEGTGLFLVNAVSQGLAVESYPLVDGTRAADIGFEGVVVPSADLLVSGNRGADVLGESIDRAAIAFMAQAVGAMEASLKICGDYVKERKQFGVTIGSFQAIQHMLSDMFVAAHQARSMLYHALANAEASPEQRRAAISAARIVVGEAGQLVSRSGIQVHGGYGLTDEYAIGHYFRRLMCLEKHFGDLSRHVEQFGKRIIAES
jgi:alkylation response protein AidB-like acyl-CoA dehydrogenase